MHPRKVIRDAVKARLIGAAPDFATPAQERVYSSMTPIANLEAVLADEGPLIALYLRQEDKIEYPTMGADAALWRTAELVVEYLSVSGIAAGGQYDIDDRLDDAAETIEGLIETLEIPNMLGTEIRLKESTIDVTDAGERILGGIFLVWDVKYWTHYRPDTSTPPPLPTEVVTVPDVTTDVPPEEPSGPAGPHIPGPGQGTDESFNEAAFLHGAEVRRV